MWSHKLTLTTQIVLSAPERLIWPSLSVPFALLSSHSAPIRREVRVQLLDQRPVQTSSQGAPGLTTGRQDAVRVADVQTEAGLSSGCLGDDTNASSSAAALIKVGLTWDQLTESQEVLHRLLEILESKFEGKIKALEVLELKYFVLHSAAQWESSSESQSPCLCLSGSVTDGGSSVSPGWRCSAAAAGWEVHTHAGLTQIIDNPADWSLILELIIVVLVLILESEMLLLLPDMHFNLTTGHCYFPVSSVSYISSISYVSSISSVSTFSFVRPVSSFSLHGLRSLNLWFRIKSLIN